MRSKATFFVIICFLLANGAALRGFGAVSRAIESPQTSVQGNETLPEEQTTVFLSNGDKLLLGGLTKNGLSDAAFLQDGKTNEVRQLSKGMLRKRVRHTATLLPNGKVLIIGGFNESKKVVQVAEMFDPSSGSFSEVSLGSIIPRADHTATLLTDGRLLIVGGIQSDESLAETPVVWDYRTGTSLELPSNSKIARTQHQARLLSDGSVLILGGKDAFGTPKSDSVEVNVPAQTVQYVSSSNSDQTEKMKPYPMASIPQAGETGVPTDQIISIRFSHSLDMASVTSASVELRSLHEKVAADVVSAEGGMLIFVSPKQKLLPGTPYVVDFADVADKEGRKPTQTSVLFTTQADSDASPIGGSSGWETVSPDAKGIASEWRKLPMRVGTSGNTSLAGQVLKLDGSPLANVSIEIGNSKTVTDNSGRFLLDELGPGHRVLIVDGASAAEHGNVYGLYRVGVDLKAHQTNNLNYTVWMTPLDTEDEVTISSPLKSDMVITNPKIPGLELHLPAGIVIKDARGNIAYKVGITAIPSGQPPFPLKRGVVFPVYFTIQPGGATFSTADGRAASLKTGKPLEKARGATIHYENHYGAKPDVPFSFWNYDPTQKGWYVYGHGRVSKDGKMIRPDEGTQIWSFDGAMVSLPSNAPPYGPKPNNPKDGEPVDLQTGLFVYSKTDLSLQDVIPIALNRKYRQADYVSRAFGIGTNTDFDMFLVGDASYTPEGYTWQDLVLADGGKVHFTRTSPCTGSNGFCNFQDAVYVATSAPGAFYGATLFYTGIVGGFWTITKKDGTILRFPDSENSSDWRQAALASITDIHGNTVTLTRDYYSNLTKVISPNGRWIQLTYDGSGRIVGALDNINRTTSYTYNAAGYLATSTDAAGGTTTYTYDDSGNMLTVTDPRQILYLQNQYDVNDMVYQQTVADGGVYKFAYSLDANSNVLQTTVTDPLNYVRQVSFNTDGYMVSDVSAVGKPERHTMLFQRQQGTGLLLSQTDGLNQTVSYGYDAEANLTTVSYQAQTANPATVSISYDARFAKPLGVIDPSGLVKRMTYSDKGDLLSQTDPAGATTLYTYNSSGQPLTVTDSLGNSTSFGYQNGSNVSVTDPLGRVTTRYLDGAGRTVSTTNALGFSTKFTYGTLDQVLTSVDPLGSVTTYGYDQNGNLLTISDAKQHVTTFTYDNMDRQITRKDALGGVSSFQYDQGGNAVSITDRNGAVTAITYDGLGRPTFVGYGMKAGPTYESTIANTYDAVGQLTKTQDSIAGSFSRSYNGVGQISSETTPYGSVSYTYDLDQRRKTMSISSQSPITYTYDNASRPTAISQGGNSIALTYDSAGRRTSLLLPNGNSQTYTYDAASQLLGIRYGGGSLSETDLAYSYDLLGRRTGVSGSAASAQLPNAITASVYNANNQLTQWGSTQLTYDSNGNTTNDGTNTYVWDTRNHLVSGNQTSFSFKYDPFGRRVSRTTSSGSTQYLYDLRNVVQELNGTSPTANLLTGNTDEYFTRTDSSGTTTFLSDALGSTMALTDSNGSAQIRYTYDPFGNVTSSAPSASNSYQFTGREFDGTGLLYYRARFYNPSIGRFLSEDPIGFAGGDVDLYAYASDSPTNNIDPSGNCPWCIGAALGFATDLTMQLVQNHGNWHCIDGGRLFASTAIGALTGGLGGEGLELGLSGLSNATKGAIGEGLSVGKNLLSGSTLLGTQVSGESLGLSTVFDSVWESISGATYYVESKFGTSGLTTAQRAAQSALGDAYHVEQWPYSGFNAFGGAAGGAFGGFLGGQMSGRGCGCN